MPTPLFALEVAELGPNCVIDSADVETHITRLSNAKSQLLRQLTILSKIYKISETERDKCYDVFRDNFDILMDNIRSDFDENKQSYIKQLNFGEYHQASINKFKSNGNSLILCDKSYGIEFMRTHKLNEIKFQLLNSSEYIQLHQSQIRVSKALHWNVYDFHVKFMKDHQLWNIKSSPGYWPFHNNLINCINKGIFPKLSTIKPYHKLHKFPHSWRKVGDFSKHPTNWYQLLLNNKLESALAFFNYKTNYKIILNNSYQLKLYLLELQRDLHTKDYEVIHRTADVEKLYRRLNIDDAKAGINWIMDLVDFEEDYIVGSIEILELVMNNAYVVANGKVTRLNQVMATGWIFSPLVANVALLRIEYNNHKSYIVLMFGRFFNHTKLLHIHLKLEVRYIDDIYEVWLINKSFINPTEIQLIKDILRNDNGIRYKADNVHSLINLKSSVEYVEIFLDLEIRFDYLCRRFITDIHRKPGKLNTLLVHTSNNSPDHFFGVFQSGLFRSICLIDSRMKQKVFMHNFKIGLRERNWSLYRIKQCANRSKLSYNKRHDYIASIQKRFTNKRLILMYHNSDKLYNKYEILSEDKHDYIHNHLLPKDDEDILYFKKIYNRFFDRDRELRVMFYTLVDQMGLNKCKIMICNMI
eukprot:526676_1